MARERDETTEFIEAMDARVTKMEKDALSAIKQRGETIGTALIKIAVGAPMIYEAIARWGLETHLPLVVLVAGTALTTWGARDAGELPERFSRASTLTTNARLLRASLTNSLVTAIEGIPSRRLEALPSQTPTELR